jgi:hypothetical protein
VDETTQEPTQHAAFIVPIGSAMIEIMRRIEAVSKSQKNVDQGFKFRGIDQVYNSLHRIMAEVGVVCLPSVISTERSSYTTKKGSGMFSAVTHMRYTFLASDGSKVEVTCLGEGADSGDKSTSKSIAIAHKYALLQTFLIPTDDMDDPDRTSPDAGEGGVAAPSPFGGDATAADMPFGAPAPTPTPAPNPQDAARERVQAAAHALAAHPTIAIPPEPTPTPPAPLTIETAVDIKIPMPGGVSMKLGDLLDEDLDALTVKLSAALADPAKAKFVAFNQRALDGARIILETRRNP